MKTNYYINLFIQARRIQQAEHRGLQDYNDAPSKARATAIIKAEEILLLTFKFGGDLVAAAKEATASHLVDIPPTVHRGQPNSEFFRSREEALVALDKAATDHDNAILREAFEALFIQTAVAAIHRHYSNGRSFFFLAPFIGGVIINNGDIGWKHLNEEELLVAIRREQERIASYRAMLEVVKAFDAEADEVGGDTPYGRSWAADVWAHVSSGHPQGNVWEVLKNLYKMSTPGIPGQPDYCTFWSAVHSGSEKAAAVLRAFNRHKNGIVEAVAGHIARWEGAPPEWATKYMAVLPVAA